MSAAGKNVIGKGTIQTDTFVSKGTGTIEGNADVGGTLDVAGKTSVGDNLDVAGALDVTGAATVGGTLDVTGMTTLDDATIVGAADVTEDLSLVGEPGVGASHINGKDDICGKASFTTNGLTKAITFGKKFPKASYTPIVVVSPIEDALAYKVAVTGDATDWTTFTVTRPEGGASGASFYYMVMGYIPST